MTASTGAFARLARFVLPLLSLLLFAALPAAHAADAPKPTHDIPLHGKGRHVESAHGRIYIETEGRGEPLVLVSGGPGFPHTIFHPWFSRLADRYTVTYMDNIGRGRSDRLKDKRGYAVERDAEDIEAVRRALGSEKITVLGHSYGTMVALAYALKYPQHTRKLVLVHPVLNGKQWQDTNDLMNAFFRQAFPDTWDAAMAARKKGLRTGDKDYPAIDANAGLTYVFHRVDRIPAMFFSNDPVDDFNPDVYAGLLGPDADMRVGGNIARYDPTPRLSRLNMPVLVIGGQWDRSTPLRLARDIVRAMPKGVAELAVIDGVGHMSYIEEPEAFFRVLEPFLAK